MICNVFEPDFCGGAAVFTDLAVGLVERGHSVTVYTTFPYYPEWQNKSKERRWRIKHETFSGVEVFRHWHFIPRNPSKLIPRLFYEFSFGLGLLPSLFRGPKYDAVIVICPLLGAVAFASLRKIVKGDPLWLSVQDIPLDAAAASGIASSKLFSFFGRKTQQFLFNRADVCSTITPGMAARLNELNSSQQEIKLCPNWLVGSARLKASKLASICKTKHQKPHKLLYCGNIGKKQGLLEFCKQLHQTNCSFQFDIHGDGSESHTLKKWIDHSDDTRFRYLGFLEESRFLQAIHSADWFVITEKPGAGFSFIPSKLIPSITVGTPILAICDVDSALGTEVVENELGRAVRWNETNTVPEFLDCISADNLGLEKLQRNCLHRARAYDRDEGIGRIEQSLADLVCQDRTSPENVSTQT